MTWICHAGGGQSACNLGRIVVLRTMGSRDPLPEQTWLENLREETVTVSNLTKGSIWKERSRAEAFTGMVTRICAK